MTRLAVSTMRSRGLKRNFQLGLPEEYGIEFGAFFDAGSVWGLSSAIWIGRQSSRLGQFIR